MKSIKDVRRFLLENDINRDQIEKVIAEYESNILSDSEFEDIIFSIQIDIEEGNLRKQIWR